VKTSAWHGAHCCYGIRGKRHYCLNAALVSFRSKEAGRCRVRLPTKHTRLRKHSKFGVVFANGGFTLLELLVVTGMIVLLLAAIVPAVTSLSKSNGRKAAIANLLGGIEQARAQAIADAQATYVAFPTFSAGTAQSTLDRYNYKSYAIFEDNAANPGSVKQLTGWKSLPTGVALRSAGTAALANLADPASLSPAPTFSFTPDTGTTPAFRCLKFNLNGEVEAPATNVLLGVFEGYVSSGTEVVTSAKDANGNPAAVEYIAVSQFTGRAEPADAVATATPTATP